MKIYLILIIALIMSSCSTSKVIDIKSPCVSNQDGPCGHKKPINDWWLKAKS